MRSGWLKVATILARALPPAARQRVLDRIVPFLAGATVLAFAAGSSSVPRATSVGHPFRWVLLVALLGAAALRSNWRAIPRTPLVAAAALVGLAALSTAWSVEPRTSFERAVSLGLLFLTCLLLAAAVAGCRHRAEALLAGVLGGAAAVGLLGLLVLAVDHAHAVESATYQSPARFRGFGQDPNTVALLFGVTTPLAVWAVLATRRRVLAASVLFLLVGTIVASGSRGALVAGAAGACVVIGARSGRSRRALVGVVAVAAIAVAGAAVQAIPSAAHVVNVSGPPPPGQPKPNPGYLNGELVYPLNADVGKPLPGGGQPFVTRSIFGSSGRVQAWEGTLHEVARRPVVGHGFGTEQAVFVDRYYSFVGGLPENSYIGLALQLGALGIAALVALVAALALPAVRALRRSRNDLVAASLGVLVAGLVAAVVQSYLYSVGNIATAALWIPVFLLPAVLDA
jgi:hypothetical protein